MQHVFATIAAQTDIPQAGASRRYAMKNWSELKMEELQTKKSPSLKTITKNEDQIMDRNNGLEAKISRVEARTKIMMNFGAIPPPLIRVSFQGYLLPMGTTVRTTEDHMINAQTSNSIEMTEIDLGMVLPTTRTGTGETMEFFVVPHRLKGETFHKIIHTASLEVINLTISPSADLTTGPRLVLKWTKLPAKQ